MQASFDEQLASIVVGLIPRVDWITSHYDRLTMFISNKPDWSTTTISFIDDN